MSSSPTSQNNNSQSTQHFYPQHNIPAEDRDPIMQDDQFSLRFGNPIKVIHDIQTHQADTFEPTKDHVSGSLADAIGNALSKQQQHQHNHHHHHHHHQSQFEEHSGASTKDSSPALSRTNSGFLRDPLLCADFYHTKTGAVSEREHLEQQ